MSSVGGRGGIDLLGIGGWRSWVEVGRVGGSEGGREAGRGGATARKKKKKD